MALVGRSYGMWRDWMMGHARLAGAVGQPVSDELSGADRCRNHRHERRDGERTRARRDRRPCDDAGAGTAGTACLTLALYDAARVPP